MHQQSCLTCGKCGKPINRPIRTIGTLTADAELVSSGPLGYQGLFYLSRKVEDIKFKGHAVFLDNANNMYVLEELYKKEK